MVEGVDESSGELVTVVYGPNEKPLTRAGGRRWDPDDPIFSLPPGTNWLQAYQGRDRERKSKPVEVIFEAGAPESTVVLRLIERPGLCETVIIDDALEVRSLAVHALRFAGDQPPSVEDPGSRPTFGWID